MPPHPALSASCTALCPAGPCSASAGTCSKLTKVIKTITRIHSRKLAFAVLIAPQAGKLPQYDNDDVNDDDDDDGDGDGDDGASSY